MLFKIYIKYKIRKILEAISRVRIRDIIIAILISSTLFYVILYTIGLMKLDFFLIIHVISSIVVVVYLDYDSGRHIDWYRKKYKEEAKRVMEQKANAR